MFVKQKNNKKLRVLKAKYHALFKQLKKTLFVGIKKTKKYLKPKIITAIVVFSDALRKTYKHFHFHLAHRPHVHFTNKYLWYKSWHEWDKHKHAHYAVLAVYVLGVGSLVFSSYYKAFAASDLFNNWDFSNQSDYSLSSGVEFDGNSVRMKAQNYSSDSNTEALYHLDESSGTNASDSSSNSNDATITNATFASGNLNNALDFNGTTSFASANDSASLSLSQDNTLEAWTKFNSPLSSSSNSQRQTIFDKGDYQLYFDNETGKIAYELVDKNANSWSLAGGNDTNGGWDQNGKRSVNATVKIGSSYYFGIGSDIGDAEVWRWNGTTWTQIGGGNPKINDSWDSNTYEGVYSLTTDGTNLYAGLGLSAGDGEVWRWNGTTWTKIGGDSLNGGWTNYSEQVWSMDYFGGKLFAGIGSSANDAEVWSWDGSSWTKIGGDSLNSGWTTNYEYAASLTNDGTNLYVGLGVSANDAEVWRWNGTTWTQIGGDSLNSGWTTNFETVRSLRFFGGKLYAGLGDSSGDAEVWEWNGTIWTRIGGDGINSSWANSTYEQIGAFAFDGTNLYTGLGTGNGDGEVWKWDGATWSQIGGDGLNNGWTTNQGDIVNTLLFDNGQLYAGTYDSAGAGLVYSWDGSNWTQLGGDYVNKSWGFYGISAVQVMQSQGGYLYAGTGNTTGAALVFRFDGSTWSLIGGQGVNGSWAPNTYEQVLSMASYNGHLFVGLGTTASGSIADGQVWEWDGSTWTQIGGDGINSSWTQASHYGEVDAMASYGGYLYAGLGQGANDGEVWQYDGSTWTKIGGDSINNGWTNYVENIYSLAIHQGKLVAGLGRSSGDGEVWQYDGSTWTKIGGDTVNSSWPSTGIESVESLTPYNGKLYAGLGSTTGDATIWEYDGTTWTKIGGDDLNSSWTTGTYEKVKTMTVYNGDLFVGLGNTTGDGEVWRYSSGGWQKIGGNSINGGWTNTVEEVESFSPYKGKLYAGTGLTTNADGLVWSWGNNAYLESSTNSFDTNWHHIAATYDGSNMKLFIDGSQDSTASSNVLLPDSSRPLLIGTSYGGREYGKARGYFDGQLDELRISNIARTNLNSRPFSDTDQTVTLTNAVRTNGVWHWDNFSSSETPNGGTINYRISSDDGVTWQFWNGTNWADSSGTSESNTVSVIDANIDTFPVTFDGIKWQAVLRSDGYQQVTLNSADLASTSDSNEPSANASNIAALKAIGGSSLAQNDWTNGSSPYFSWDAAADTDSGIKGYCLYLGTDNTADPVTTKGLLGNSPVYTGGKCQFIVDSEEIDMATSGYIATALTTSNSPYYLSIKAIDNAGNISSTSSQFYFRFDNTPPTNPSYITAPSGFINTKDVNLSWPTVGGSAPADSNSGLAGLQYKINETNWYGDSHTGSGDINDLLTNDGSYQTVPTPDYNNLDEGVNTVYFRTWDQAGNVTTTYSNAALKINTSGAPSEPQNVVATPSTNTSNSFAFSWSQPNTFVGDANNITYCYTINVVPSSSNCTFTSAGTTSLGAGPYATQPGTNTFYVVARDESSNINYDSYSTAQFSANTPSPGIPLNNDIVDVSIKATSNWRLAITWDAPTYTGAGISSYKVYRSTDNTNFTFVGSSSSTTYIDAGLTQQRYYYKVDACDSTNNCGAYSSVVNELPTGKFTSPANLVAEPTTTNITTRKATISWSTDRASDSKVSIGTKSGEYSPSEVSISEQVSAHKVELSNLSAGTTYYYVAKWTDEDGNTGVSQEFTFNTAPAPSLKEISTTKIGLSDAAIRFTSKNANRIEILYGKSESFGGIKTINTSIAESSYDVALDGLEDGSKYFYKLIAYDNEDNSYDGSIFSFVTPARPKILDLRFQPIAGEPTSTQEVTWTTNVPATSTITYGKNGTSGSDIQESKLTTKHRIIIRNLEDDSEYFLIAQSRDAGGNLAVSDRQEFKTALDTRPPEVSDIQIETSIRGTGAEARGQVVVSWKTDEPSTSQVAYAEGSNTEIFNNKTSEDGALATEHIVIVSDLPTSRVYSIQPVSRDRSGNEGLGEPQSAIIGRASDSVLTIILNALQKVFGF